MDSVLLGAFGGVWGSFLPVPPPLTLKVDNDAPTFCVDLSTLIVCAPAYWHELKCCREFLGHEIKHASSDGLPYTYLNALKFEACVMKMSGLDLGVVRRVLNLVYDVVVDLRVATEGLDAKGMCIEWLDRFPIDAKSEGSSYHLLQIIYKDLFGAQLRETRYETQLRRNVEYEKLKQTLTLLAANSRLRDEQQTTEWITLAALMVVRLSNFQTPSSTKKDPQKKDMQSEGGDVWFDRGDTRVRLDAAEIGVDIGLNSQQLAQLMGVTVEELTQVLQMIAEDKARSVLWSTLVGFRGFSSNSSVPLDVIEPIRQRWKPYSKHLDPSSILKAPNDPRKWQAQTQTTALTIKQKSGESGGFTKLIILIDCSSSTATPYQTKTVLGYLKDAAYSLIAYAKKTSIPIATIGFNRDAWIIAKESKDYLTHAQEVFLLKPRGITNLVNAVQLTTVLRPRKALIALLTDGYVTQQELWCLTEQTQANKVIAAIANPANETTEGIKNLKALSDEHRDIQLFEVRPDKAGKTIIELLPKTSP
jgi:hypothetical protein